jgi:uncharacterized protein
MIKSMIKARSPFHIMVKPRGPVCNMACDYCYYLPKKHAYPGSDFRMSEALLLDFTQQMINAQPAQQVEFSWQGGEPTLMGLDFFKKVVDVQKQFTPRGMQISNTIQTNGTLLTPAWCRFLKQHDFLVGLSLDGPPALHNMFRTTKSGRDRYDAVMRAAHLLKQHRVDVNILCCVHHGNVLKPLEVYHFLRDTIGFQFIQFIPIVQRQTDPTHVQVTQDPSPSISGGLYGQFLKTVFDDWVQHDVGKVYIQLFDLALGVWAGQPASLCVFSKICGRALVLEHNGDLYTCDHFVTPEHKLGNITKTPLVALVDSDQQRQFGQNKFDQLSVTCLDCPVRFICNGGCPKNRDENGLNLLCDGYQSFFSHIKPVMNRMADLLRQNRAPAEVMDMINSGEI